MSQVAVPEYKLPDIHTLYGIPIQIEEDKDGFIVSDDIINMYGIGDTIENAIEDYKSTIIEYYDFLVAEEVNLAKHLKEHLDYLKIKLIGVA